MDYKYKAFISYRHVEPDMQAAERLQKILEAYKPPKSLGIKKENWRIFRDVSELQSSSDLSEIIKNAIESSEYLIVLCSPQYNESKWCLQELTRFRELHDNKNTNIITLLVNGDPQESFPEELTYTEVTTINEKGEEVTVREDVEPLAANIVADNIRDSMKKLKTESLRIAAPLLGCDFNDLFQREKRREAARRRLIFGGVSGVLSLISVISVASAVTINGKNKQIQQQNDQIIEQNDQIKAQNAEIESKNSALLIENAKHLAVESENLFIENDLIPAIKKAVEALPASGEDKPVLPEAEYALSRELGMFNHTQLAPRMSLKHECAVEQLSFMGGGKSIVSTDATGVYFWNAETGELIRKISADDSEFASDAGGAGKLTAYFDINTDKTGTKFTKTSAPGNISYDGFKQMYDCYIHSVSEDEPGTGGDVYIYNSDSDLWRIDGATGEVKWSVPKSENAYSYYDIIMYEKYVLRVFLEKKELTNGTVIMGNDYYLEMIDSETGRVEDTVKMEFDGNILGLSRDFEIKAIHDGVIYICENGDTLKAYETDNHTMKSVREVEVNYPEPLAVNNCCLRFHNNEPLLAASSVSFNLTTDLTRFNQDMTEKKWSVSLPVNYQNNGKTFLMPADQINSEHDILVVTTNRTISFLDYETGDLIKNLSLDGEITDVSFSRNGLVMYTLKNGEEYMLSVKDYMTGDDSDNRIYRLQTFNTNFSLCSYSLGKYVTAENFSNTAYIQYTKQNAMFGGIDTGEFMYNRDVIAVTNDGTKAAVVSTYYPDNTYDSDKITYHLFLFDSKSGECNEITSLEKYRINSAAFTDSNKLIVNVKEPGSTEDKTMCVDLDGGKTEDIKVSSRSMCFETGLIPSAGGVFYLDKYEKNIIFVSSDGSAKAWASDQEGKSSADKELSDKMFAVSGCKAAMYVQFNDGDGRTELIVHDFSADQDITLDYDTSNSEKRKIQRIFWQNTSTVGVFFNDRTVSLFDADTGRLKNTVSLDGTSQEPVSVAAVSDDTFAVLCRDSNLYEMNAEGFTGRSCRLDFAGNEDNDIFEYDSSAASLFETKASSDKNRIFAVWKKSRAWVLDTSGFSVRFRIDNFAAAPPEGDTVYISDSDKNKIGLFPIYTTQQLLETAKNYLSALGQD